MELGADERSGHWCRRLASSQGPDGSFADGAGCRSLYHTGQALRGLLAYVASPARAQPQVVAAAERAALFLCSQLGSPGRSHRGGARPGSLDRWGPPALHVAWLRSLVSASRQLGEPRWEEAALRRLTSIERCCDLTRWNCPSHFWAIIVEALIDLGRLEAARAALRLPSAAQRRDGSIPALPAERWVSSAGMAQLARCGYRLGGASERAMADRALAALVGWQSASGGFRGSWGAQARYYTRRDVSHAAWSFLQATIWQARSAFAGGSGFPAEISTDDGRLRAVVDWSQRLEDASRIVDVGCGKGRFLRHLLRRQPMARLTGIDMSAPDLRRLPPNIEGRCGEMLNLPGADGEFDAALCVEALEHSLLPQRAIAELCRVIRPGGAILIIDKDRRRQALSNHQPWERWFTAEEVCRWLAEHCDEVAAHAVRHGPQSASGALFWCWTARRRRLAVRTAA
jgi:malonyl-CoA O-methyltransferase